MYKNNELEGTKSYKNDDEVRLLLHQLRHKNQSYQDMDDCQIVVLALEEFIYGTSPRKQYKKYKAY